MLETREKVIGAHTYHVRQLGGAEARKLLVRLTKALGPVLGSLLEDMGGVSGNRATNLVRLQDLDVKAVSKALNQLAAQLTETDLEYLVGVLGMATMAEDSEGKALQLTKERMELHFSGGRMGEMFKWLGFALEVQFADFFSAFAPAPKADADAGEKVS